MTRTIGGLALVAAIGIGAPMLAACSGDDDGATVAQVAEDDASAEGSSPTRDETASSDGSNTATDTTTDTTTDTAPEESAAPAGDGGDSTTGSANDGSVETAGESTDGANVEAGADADGADIDWATVDLTSIDWVGIDMATVDFTAIEANPTVSDLDDDTLALIQQRYTDEVAAAEDAGTGEATLTIGSEVWELDGFVCAFGYRNTESEVFSFSSNAFGTLGDGTRTQLQANIWDESGSDSLTGPGTDHEITFDDIDNFDDPAVDWLMTGSELTIEDTVVSVDGATFRDLSTGDERQGSFVGDCGPGSRF